MNVPRRQNIWLRLGINSGDALCRPLSAIKRAVIEI
jgi:hypothetical protein